MYFFKLVNILIKLFVIFESVFYNSYVIYIISKGDVNYED